MTSLVVIPARLAATRLPHKPLRDLGGAPLIVRVWQRVTALAVADACVVATDDPRVRDVVVGAGGRAVLTRADHPSGTDRVAEVVTRDEFAGVELVVNVQGDEPFVGVDVVRAAAGVVSSGAAPIGTAAAPATPDMLGAPDVVKVVCDDRGRALYFSRAPIPYLRDGSDAGAVETRDRLVRRHIGVYAYTREALLRWVSLPPHPLELVEQLEQLRPLASGIAIGVGSVDAAGEPGVDTPADLARANVRWRAEHGDHAHPVAVASVAASVDPGPHSALMRAPSGAPSPRPEPAR